MDLQELKALAFKHLGNRKAHPERERGFIYYHGQRVAKLAVTLRKLIIPDVEDKDDILTVAAYFHDIAKGIEPHSRYGAIIVEELLKDYSEPDELVEICDLIRSHLKTKPDKQMTKREMVLQDADILEQFGTLELWTNFQYYANTDAPIEESVKFYQEKFDGHAQRISGYLNFEISKKICREKIAFVKQFTDRMAVEAAGEIYNLDSF
ncbi:MAG: HD domain-containing protein [Clostridiales bacterium]|nr:HD domain-containing protein [Clostridiales bacterium]